MNDLIPTGDRIYEPPSITEIGTVHELTLAGGGEINFDNQFPFIFASTSIFP